VGGVGQAGFGAGGHARDTGAWATSTGGAGGVAQAKSSAQATLAGNIAPKDDNGRNATRIEEVTVGWVLFEVIAALAAAVGIVWWTFPRKPRAEDAPVKDEPPQGPGAR